jgi:hypothetical protein
MKLKFAKFAQKSRRLIGRQKVANTANPQRLLQILTRQGQAHESFVSASRSFLGSFFLSGFFSVCALAIIAGLTGCGSAPVGPETPLSGLQQGQWETKTLVRDLKRNKSNIVGMDILAERPGRLRLEVSGTMGIPVASLTLKDGEIQYLIPREKKFYYGKVGPTALAPVIAVPVDPSLLFHLLFEDMPPSKEWVCEYDAGKRLKSCEEAATQTRIEWSNRSGNLKHIRLAARDYEIQIQVKDFKSKVQVKPTTFHLESPANYRKVQIP